MGLTDRHISILTVGLGSVVGLGTALHMWMPSGLSLWAMSEVLAEMRSSTPVKVTGAKPQLTWPQMMVLPTYLGPWPCGPDVVSSLSSTSGEKEAGMVSILVVSKVSHFGCVFSMCLRYSSYISNVK